MNSGYEHNSGAVTVLEIRPQTDQTEYGIHDHSVMRWKFQDNIMNV